MLIYFYFFSKVYPCPQRLGGHIGRTPSNKEPDEKKLNGRGERMKQGLQVKISQQSDSDTCVSESIKVRHDSD